MHLAPQPAARHEHEPLAALGELVGELHRDPAAERVPDHGHALVAERRQHVAHAARVRAERVVPARRRRLAVPEQVGREHREVLAQQRRDVLPRLRRVRDAVQQQEHRATTGNPVRHPVSVQGQFVGREHHPTTMMPCAIGPSGVSIRGAGTGATGRLEAQGFDDGGERRHEDPHSRDLGDRRVRVAGGPPRRQQRAPALRRRHLALVRGDDRRDLRPARGQPARRRHPQRADVDDEHRRLHVERAGRGAARHHRPWRDRVAPHRHDRDARADGAPRPERPVLQLVRPPDGSEADELAADRRAADADPLLRRQRLARHRPAPRRAARAGAGTARARRCSTR